jgi:hypothetical protein
MIKLLVDEAYAFDYLSILDLKRQKSSDSYDAWINCYKYLQNQFDNDKWLSMIYSSEYKEMLKANTLTFDAVEKAKNNEVSAQYVDECNYLRYKAKQNFQKNFFSESLSELKLGYEKYAHKSRTV